MVTILEDVGLTEMFTADRGTEIHDTAKIHMLGFTSLNCRGLGCPGLSMVQYRTTDLPHLHQQLKARWDALRYLK